MNRKTLTSTEIEIVNSLNDHLYTVSFLEEWINRDDNVFVNAPAALQAMGAHGFYTAVRRMSEIEKKEETI